MPETSLTTTRRPGRGLQPTVRAALGVLVGLCLAHCAGLGGTDAETQQWRWRLQTLPVGRYLVQLPLPEAAIGPAGDEISQPMEMVSRKLDDAGGRGADLGAFRSTGGGDPRETRLASWLFDCSAVTGAGGGDLCLIALDVWALHFDAPLGSDQTVTNLVATYRDRVEQARPFDERRTRSELVWRRGLRWYRRRSREDDRRLFLHSSYPLDRELALAITWSSLSRAADALVEDLADGGVRQTRFGWPSE